MPVVTHRGGVLHDFRAYLLGLDAKKPVILCGDLNVAHQEIDIKNARTNRIAKPPAPRRARRGRAPPCRCRW